MCRASYSSSLLALSSTDVSSQLMGWWFSHACSTTPDFSIIPQFGPQSLFGLPSVNLATAVGDTVYYIGLVTHGWCILDPG